MPKVKIDAQRLRKTYATYRVPPRDLIYGDNIDQETVDRFDWKQSVKVATTNPLTSPLPTKILPSPGFPLTVDGYTLVNGDRILIKDQTDKPENGIYIYQTLGASLYWFERSDDAKQGTLSAGTAVYVEQGVDNKTTGWFMTTVDPITIGISQIVWEKFYQSGIFTTAGVGDLRAKTTYSVSFDSSNRYPDELGDDVFFYVSGSIDADRRAVFGGDVVISGSLRQGNTVDASGQYSHAEGYLTTGSANYSHVEGYRTTALGQASHAEGFNSVSGGDYSHAAGDFTIAAGQASHTEGKSTYALGNWSHAEGQSSTAAGEYSHAEGFNTVSEGSYTHAEGSLTCASGSYSHVEGFRTVASGTYSHAEGGYAISVGLASHAEGSNTLTSGDYAHAEGYLSTGSANFSHAEGYLTITKGLYSHAEGIGTIASGSGQHVGGKYNIRNNNFSLFVIGDGSGDSNDLRHDVLRVNSGSVEMTGSLLLSGNITAVGGELQILPNSQDVSPGNDVFFYVSGSISGSGIHDKKTVFGGDVRVSGSLYANSISGSLTRLTDGKSYLVAGSNVTITSGSNGQVTISSTSSVSSAELSLVAGLFSVGTSTFTRIGGRKIDFSQYPATLGDKNRVVNFLADVDMTPGVASIEVRLYDRTDSTAITNTTMSSTSIATVELDSGPLTVGSSSGDLRDDAPKFYEVQLRMVGGSIGTDQVFCENARLNIIYI